MRNVSGLFSSSAFITMLDFQSGEQDKSAAYRRVSTGPRASCGFPLDWAMSGQLGVSERRR